MLSLSYTQLSSRPSVTLRLTIGCWLLVGIGWSLVATSSKPGDYANYHYASLLLRQGVSAGDIYDPAIFNGLIYDLGERNHFVNYAPVPPFSLLFYQGFSFLPFFYSKLIFNILGVLLSGYALYRLLSYEKIFNPFLLLLPLVFWLPLKQNILLGQSYLYLFFFLTEGYIGWQKGKTWQAALCFGLAISLKWFPAILLLPLFFQKQYRLTFYTLGITLLLGLSPAAFMGMDNWWAYHSQILPRLFQNEINDPFSISYQSFNVLLKKLFVSDAHLNPTPLFSSPAWADLGLLVYNALLLSLSVSFLRYKLISPLIVLGFSLFAGMLLTGYGSTYGLLGLLFLSLGLLNHKNDTFFLACSGLFIMLIDNLPIPSFSGLPIPLQFPRLYLMLMLFIFLAYKYSVRLHWRQTLFCLSLLTIPATLRLFSLGEAPAYYSSTAQPLLTCDYAIGQREIKYKHYGIQGPFELNNSTHDKFETDSSLTLSQGQIQFKGKKLTHSPDQKKKPMLLNDTLIVYLSDYGRGPGFYCLRKLLPDSTTRKSLKERSSIP